MTDPISKLKTMKVKQALDEAGQAWDVATHGVPAFCAGYSGDGWSWSSASCGVELTQPAVGRTRVYCSDACRAGAYRRRRQHREREEARRAEALRQQWLASDEHARRAVAAEVRQVLDQLGRIANPTSGPLRQLDQRDRARAIERMAVARGHLAHLADDWHPQPLPAWREPLDQPPPGWTPDP